MTLLAGLNTKLFSKSRLNLEKHKKYEKGSSDHMSGIIFRISFDKIKHGDIFPTFPWNTQNRLFFCFKNGGKVVDNNKKVHRSQYDQNVILVSYEKGIQDCSDRFSNMYYSDS